MPVASSITPACAHTWPNWAWMLAVFLQRLQLTEQLHLPCSELHSVGGADSGEGSRQGEVVMGDDGLGA